MRVLALVLIACASPPAPPAEKPATARTTPAPPGRAGRAPAISPEAACARLPVLAAAGCGNFAHMRIAPESCPQLMTGMMKERAGEAMVRCLSTHDACDDVLACIAAPDEPAAATLEPALPEHREPCTNHAPGAMVGTSDYAHRNTAIHLPDAQSSKQHPLEVCGFDAEAKLLQTMTCADLSRPLATAMDVERARVGDVGSGGRCNSIIDHYRIVCSDKPYDVYVDAYLCPK